MGKGIPAHGYRLEQVRLGPLTASCPPSPESLPDKAERDQYELLCLDNTRKPVEEFRDCHLARVPSHAVVARSVGGKEDSIWDLLRRAQVSAPIALPPAWIWFWRFLPPLTSCHSRSLCSLTAQACLDSVDCLPRLSSGQQELGSPSSITS